MPISPTYPGVYIAELPSGVRTVTGVATSIAAFIGRAQRGADNVPITINGFGDFEREFGGLWLGSPMSFAVRDFFLNGGTQAIVVRLHLNATVYSFSIGATQLQAISPGTWGLNLRASVDTTDLAAGGVFNLTVRDLSNGGRVEQFRNLTYADGPRKIDKVLLNESALVQWKSGATLTSGLTPTVGDDAVSVAEKNLAAAIASGAGIATAQDALVSAKNTAATGVRDGDVLDNSVFIGGTTEADKKGLYALKRADLFNLLCIPPHSYPSGDINNSLIAAAVAYCETRNAMLLVDPPYTWVDKTTAKAKFTDSTGTATDNVGTRSRNAALYFPRLIQPNPLRGQQLEAFAPCGAVAGVIASTDAAVGVWKAPAGQEATLVGVSKLSYQLTDAENGELNQLGINCLRSLPAAGRVVWGARTLQGDDRLASEWKYVPVRRLALYIAESVYRGSQWAVFEPNGEPLWSQMRLNLGTFMQDLFRRGAFQGKTPNESYFVKCDSQTTTQSDINQGVVNVLIGFAPVKPAEFVVIQLQQMAGQSA